MRFMILVKASTSSEAGIEPDAGLVEEMGKYHEDLMRAGVLLAADGLKPSSKGARITISGTRRIVRDGPFTEAKELIAGYTMIDVKSREEAIEWAKRFPNPHPGEESVIELRAVYELSDLVDAPRVAAEPRTIVDP